MLKIRFIASFVYGKSLQACIHNNKPFPSLRLTIFIQFLDRFIRTLHPSRSALLMSGHLTPVIIKLVTCNSFLRLLIVFMI
jgi:hypothetical protein